MLLAKWFSLQFDQINSLKIDQYPELILDPSVLEKILIENKGSVRYSLDSLATFDFTTKEHILDLLYRKDFRNITLLKFSTTFFMTQDNAIALGDCLYLDMSFSDFLQFLKKINSLEQLKAFW